MRRFVKDEAVGQVADRLLERTRSRAADLRVNPRHSGIVEDAVEPLQAAKHRGPVVLEHIVPEGADGRSRVFAGLQFGANQ